jgi:hypothetical protein
MGQGVPAEGADLVAQQKILIIQSLIKRALPGKVPDLIQKMVDFDACVRLHLARISNNIAALCKIIVVKRARLIEI